MPEAGSAELRQTRSCSQDTLISKGEDNNYVHLAQLAIREHQGRIGVIREDFQEEVASESHRLSRSWPGGGEGQYGMRHSMQRNPRSKREKEQGVN